MENKKRIIISIVVLLLIAVFLIFGCVKWFSVEKAEDTVKHKVIYSLK